jgi:hypothetical protein
MITRLDYGKKILGPVKAVDASLPYNEVLKEIASCYMGVTGKKTNQFDVPDYE